MFTKEDQLDLFTEAPGRKRQAEKRHEIDYDISGVRWNITHLKCERAPISYFQTLAHRATPLLMYGVSNDNKCLYLITNITKQ